ncbi:MAG: hypothetical protein JJ911_01350 [Rhizobiaceae bacterium]|nr:hypothetical protein [Rhizobiaceae bacterium]
MNRNLVLFLGAPTPVAVGSFGQLALTTLATLAPRGKIDVAGLRQWLQHLQANYPINHVTVNAGGRRVRARKAVLDTIQEFAAGAKATLSVVDLSDVYELAIGKRRPTTAEIRHNALVRTDATASQGEAIAALMFHYALTEQVKSCEEGDSE